MVKAATKGATARELISLVAYANGLRDQNRPPRPDHAFERRGIRRAATRDGMTTLIITLPTEDAERLIAVLDTYLRHLGRPAAPETNPAAEAADKDSAEADAAADPVDKDSAEANLDKTSSIDTNRFTVNVNIDYATLVERAPGAATTSGEPLTGEAARRLACDAGITRIITDGPSTILDLGRTTDHAAVLTSPHGAHITIPRPNHHHAAA